MDEFEACFADLEDPRDDNARHDLLEVLMIALCTMVCGGEDCTDVAAAGSAALRIPEREGQTAAERTVGVLGGDGGSVGVPVHPVHHQNAAVETR